MDEESISVDVNSLASKVLNQIKSNTKSDIMEGVAFYSSAAITREWETLRSQWYQNNLQFKPKYRKYTNLNKMSHVSNPNSSQIVTNHLSNSSLGGLNNNNVMKNFNDNKIN